MNLLYYLVPLGWHSVLLVLSFVSTRMHYKQLGPSKHIDWTPFALCCFFLTASAVLISLQLHFTTLNLQYWLLSSYMNLALIFEFTPFWWLAHHGPLKWPTRILASLNLCSLAGCTIGVLLLPAAANWIWPTAYTLTRCGEIVVVCHYLAKMKGWLTIMKDWRDSKIKSHGTSAICHIPFIVAMWCTASTIPNTEKSLFTQAMIASLPVVMIMSLQRLWVRSNVRDSQTTAITPQIAQPNSPSDLQPVTITSKVTQLNNPLDASLTVNKDRAESGIELKDADAKDSGPELINERVSTDWEGAMGLEARQPGMNRFSWEERALS